jgi:hypothetical protein
VYTFVVAASLFLDVRQYASGKLLSAASVSNRMQLGIDHDGGKATQARINVPDISRY